MNELREMLKNIRKELTTLYEATDEEREALEEEGEASSFCEYILDALDIEYIVSRRLSYLGARIYVTLGGPNIYIDTRLREIRGAWGSERKIEWLPSEICDEIDIILEDIYNCQKGA